MIRFGVYRTDSIFFLLSINRRAVAGSALLRQQLIDIIMMIILYVHLSLSLCIWKKGLFVIYV